ncbi:LOW QUALITY PROTEIN: ubiquitin carboxyl-terminal hydrolase 40 [Megalobrama amblycephala]|uniref:LOW QUALITY PROTEIN: ubiquitin carboxyl-terminal hydrolase 40 n=1 Tax=Megalobrama amblycephala TaxID=75352 RepID=UPI002013F158|nr:LOW QUALITY PROTEIN: ubiquitin carboxyl-terminal hydrolase 40 [Megalobrama amblycephala]
MFGDLFEEDGDGFSSSTPGTGVKGRESEPPPPRGKVKLCGIKNQGGTCYLNSLIQTLLFTPEFREELFRLGPDELGCLADKTKPEAKVRVIPLELQRLFSRLLLVDEQTASTTDLTDSFGWTNNEEMGQQDVQELNRILFSAVESSLVGTSGSSLIHRLYHGTLVNQITCKECGNISERQEDFLDLTVSVRGVSGLEEALWNMFVEEEMFEGNNLYRCSRCDRLVRAAKSAKLRKLPPFLTISLLRFNFDFAKCERYKETGSYTFPLEFNLRAFCEQSNWPDSEYSYELFSVIIHKGGCYGGHYHVYIKDIDQLGHWEAPEEEVKIKAKTQRREAKVEERKKESENCVDTEDPLSVLTGILAQEESKCVLVDQLGQKLMNKTGTAWSKKYKKQYGTISKFLQSHPNVFMLVSNGTRVTLKNAVPAATEPSPTEPVRSTSAKSSTEIIEPETAGDTDGCHWFDLNDSTVTAITVKDIEKQFQGKESAYMLFYRKTTMERPPEAIGNPAYKVPPHLVEMVQEENARVQQRRAEFDASSNSIEVRLHLAPHYHCQNGALHPTAPNEDSIITVTFDRRKTVGDLRLAIYQMQDLWEGDMALTLAKNVPAGLHLYDTLTDDQMSLYSAGVCHGSDLFVWNGREVNGVVVQTGIEWEPVLLTVLRPSAEELGCGDGSGVGDTDGSGLVRSMKGFAGGATLGTVLEALGPQKAFLCQEQSRPGASGGGASGWRVFPPQDMQRTLRELSLKDGDALLLLQPEELDSSIFSLSGDVVTVTTPSDCRWLQVEFCPQSGMKEEEEEEQGKKRSKVSASGNMLLAEVKEKALEELRLQDELSGVECCLRQMDRSGKLLPPVHEHLSVRDAGIRLMTSLYLCPGPVPTATQLFLYFSIGLAPSVGQELEIIVEESLTVKECLKEMLQMARLEGESWHLRRVDWCEEIGEPLMDENASLKEAKVIHGDTLVLVEGRLPPKGYLKLSVRMYMDMIDSSSVPELNHTAESQSIEGLTTEWSGSEMKFIGYVEISEEASLDDLKTQVMTLPALQDVCVPSPAFLRVWQLEGKKLSRILRGNPQTLRKLKLGNGAEVCIQRLMKEEDLGLKDLLLRVQMGVPGEKAYYPSEEFLWDAGRDGTPRGLYAALASQYGLTPDNLLLAKHLPDKHTWMPISNWTQQVSKRKKKRKAESLQAAPFYLKDGDIIGIKNLLIDNNKEFTTLEDEIGQQRLREEAANLNTRGRTATGECSQDSGSKKSGSTKNRKPEVALSINVGVFR